MRLAPAAKLALAVSFASCLVGCAEATDHVAADAVADGAGYATADASAGAVGGETARAPRVCVPLCDERECGTDGCGGTCGSCGPDERCDKGHCMPDWVPAPGPCTMDADGDGDGRFERRQVFEYEERRLVRATMDGGSGESPDGVPDEFITYVRADDGRLLEKLWDRDGDGVSDWRSELTYDDEGRMSGRLIDTDADTVVDEVWLYVYPGPGLPNASAARVERDGDGVIDMRLTYTYDDRGDRETTYWEIGRDGGWEPYVLYRYTHDSWHNLLSQEIDRRADGTWDGRNVFDYSCWR